MLGIDHRLTLSRLNFYFNTFLAVVCLAILTGGIMAKENVFANRYLHLSCKLSSLWLKVVLVRQKS